MRAAEAAARLFALERARGHATDALAALAQVDDSPAVRRQRVDALVHLVRASLFADHPDVNFARCAEAAELLDSLDPLLEDVQRRAWLSYGRGRTAYVANDMRQATRWFKEVMAAQPEAHDPELIALPASVLGRTLTLQGHYGRGGELLQKAVLPMERLGNWLEWISVVGFQAIAAGAQGRCAEAEAYAERVLAQARVLDSPAGWTVAHITRHRAFFVMGDDMERAANAARAAAERAERTGNRMFWYLGLFFLAWTEASRRLADAKAHVARAREVALTLGSHVLVAELMAACEAELALLAGDAQEAAALAEQGVALSARVESLIAGGLAERTWGQALIALSQPEQAEAHFTRSLALFEQGDALLEAARTRVAWALLLPVSSAMSPPHARRSPPPWPSSPRLD